MSKKCFQSVGVKEKIALENRSLGETTPYTHI